MLLIVVNLVSHFYESYQFPSYLQSCVPDAISIIAHGLLTTLTAQCSL